MKCTRIYHRRTLRGKELLKRWAFVVKSKITESVTASAKLLETFLPKKMLSIDQKAFEAPRGLSNFSAVFFWYFSFAAILKLEHSINLTIRSSLDESDGFL